MTFANNPLYQPAYEGSPLYLPKDVANGYHMSRYVAAGAQNIYSASGATKELLSQYLNKIEELCNDDKSRTFRTDVGTLVNNLKYRMRYPVDEDCALRMAAIYTFIEGENPDEVNDIFTRKKLELMKSNNQAYSFFLSMGIQFTESWRQLEDHLINSDYFQQRMQALEQLSIKA